MRINHFFITSIFVVSLLFTTSCSIIKKSADTSGNTIMLQKLQAQLIPNSLQVGQIKSLKLEFMNATADTITFPTHSRIAVTFPLGKSATAVEDTLFWNNNQAATPTKGWAYTSFSDGRSNITNGSQLFKLPPKGIIYIDYSALKPSAQGTAKITLGINGNTIGLPATISLKKTQGDISVQFTARPNTIITNTDTVKFHWKVNNAKTTTFNGTIVPSVSDTTLSYVSLPLGNYPYILNASTTEKSKNDTITIYLKNNYSTSKVDTSAPLTIWSSSSSIFRMDNPAQEFQYSDNGISNWISKSALPPTQMSSSPAVFFKGYSYLVGGSRIEPDILSNDVYHYKDGNWSRSDISVPWVKRMGQSVLLYKKKLYVIGGFNEFGNPLNDVWSWDGSETGWIKETSLHTDNARGVFISGVNEGDNTIWIGGGFSSFSGRPVNNFLTYDGTNWKELYFDSPPINLCAGSFQYANDKFYLITTEYSNQQIGSYPGEINEIVKNQGNNKWTFIKRNDYQEVIPSQCFDINTTYFNGALWIRSLNYDGTGPGLSYFVP
tara:strand:- start:53661 stop:55307 length:1647 start_codon:yes stop_codon:yes gene_type:complete